MGIFYGILFYNDITTGKVDVKSSTVIFSQIMAFNLRGYITKAEAKATFKMNLDTFVLTDSSYIVVEVTSTYEVKAKTSEIARFQVRA
jgi:hypothetical protein